MLSRVSARRHNQAAILAGLAAALLACASLSRRERVEPVPSTAASPPAATSPGLSVAERPLVARTPSSPASAVSAVRVRGRLLAPSGLSLAAARVHVVTWLADRGGDTNGDPRDERTLTTVGVKEDGTFDVPSVALPDGVSRVRVVAQVPGFVTLWQEGVPAADGTVTVDLPLDQALKTPMPPWSGRVVDAHGRPVPDLPVFLEATPYDGNSIEAYRIDEGTGAYLGSGGWPLGQLRGSARTDAAGRWEIRGLTCGGCGRLHSGSPDWFLPDDAGNRSFARRNEASVVAFPAGRLAVVAVDEDDAPIAFQVYGAPEDGVEWQASSARGLLDVLWPLPSAGARTEVVVTAAGRRRVALTLSGSDSVPRRVRLLLAGPDDVGRFALWLSGPGARDVAAQATVSLRAIGTSLVVAQPRLQATVEDRLEAEVPAGTFDATVTLRSDPEGFLRTRGTVRIDGRGRGELRWDVPALGRLRVLSAFPDEAPLRLVARSASGTRLEAAYGETHLLPAGEWDVDLVDASGTVQRSGHVEVVAGERRSLRLDPE